MHGEERVCVNLSRTSQAGLLMRCLQRSSVRAWPYWGWLLLLCTTIEPSEVTAARRSVRSSRGDQDPWQLQSSGFSGPTAQALAQFAEGPLNGNPAKWRHTHEDYVKWVEVRTCMNSKPDLASSYILRAISNEGSMRYLSLDGAFRTPKKISSS